MGWHQTRVIVIATCVCACATAQEVRRGANTLEVSAAWRIRAGVQSWSGGGERQAGYALHRFRGVIRYLPADWFGAEAELQDSRVFDGDREHALEAFRDPFEFRIAKVRFGKQEGNGWTLVAGRQEVSLGEERLLGSDAEWCNLARSFDGGRGEWRRGRWRVETLAVRVVGVESAQLNRFWNGDDVAAVSVTGELLDGALRLTPQTIVAEVSGGTAPRRLTTTGLAWSWQMPRGGVWEGEVHGQAGSNSSAQAFASTLSVPAPWRRGEAEWSTGLTWASGGTDARGRIRTFHDLYPAGHNGCGLLDPFAWRNLIDVMGGMSWKMPRGWTGSLEDHTYWLASRADGLYVDGGSPLWFAGASDSRFAGHQSNVIFQHAWRHQVFAVGLAVLHTGGFVRNSGGPSSAATAFVSWDLRSRP